MLRLENISKALQTLMELLYFHPQLWFCATKAEGETWQNLRVTKNKTCSNVKLYLSHIEFNSTQNAPKPRQPTDLRIPKARHNKLVWSDHDCTFCMLMLTKWFNKDLSLLWYSVCTVWLHEGVANENDSKSNRSFIKSGIYKILFKMWKPSNASDLVSSSFHIHALRVSEALGTLDDTSSDNGAPACCATVQAS